MKKKMMAFFTACLLIVSWLTSCMSASDTTSATGSKDVIITEYGTGELREKASAAQKWAGEHAVSEETQPDVSCVRDVLTENGTSYLLVTVSSPDGDDIVYSDRIEKHENGTVTVLCSTDDQSVISCPLRLIRDGGNILLFVSDGAGSPSWGTRGSIIITYQNSDIEIIRYSLEDEGSNGTSSDETEQAGNRLSFLHMLRTKENVRGMMFVSAPDPDGDEDTTTRVFELNDELIPVSATVIDSSGKHEEVYSPHGSESIDGNGQQSGASGQSQQFVSAYSHDLRQGVLSDFDIAFLKAENWRTNMVYSPLSIKYALKMLEEGAAGNTRQQISDILGEYKIPRYASGRYLSLANALMVRSSYMENIREEYKNNLKGRYDAEVSFFWGSDPDYINTWVMRKTLNMIPEIIEEIDDDQVFFLINALGIDIPWKIRFFDSAERYRNGYIYNVEYIHERYWGGCNVETVASRTFDNGTKNTKVSGMELFASMDNYDIVSILGEDNIKKTVGDAYREWIAETDWEWYYENGHYTVLTDPDKIENEIERYLDVYIREIKRNYTEMGEVASIDFMLYADDEVKAFAKDLEECDGVQLQYVGIMPVSETLDSFIESADSEKINLIIDSLKDLKRENFKDGVITKISGFVPKFDFDYELQLTNDLKQLGITDIFDSQKADISGITGAPGTYIDKTVHKAKIEFTQDGIKAAAATVMGGMGSDGDGFDYIYEVPVEEIDLTFDRPFMFIIRDKATGEIWFAGAVYDPLKWTDDRTREEFYDFEG